MKKKTEENKFDHLEAIRNNAEAIRIAFGKEALSREDRDTLARYEGFHFCPALWDDRPVAAWDPEQLPFSETIKEIQRELKKVWKKDFQTRMATLKEASRGNIFMPEYLTESLAQGIQSTCWRIKTVYDPYPRAGRMLRSLERRYGDQEITYYAGVTDDISRQVIGRLNPGFRLVENEEEMEPVDLLVTSLTDYQVSKEDPSGDNFLYRMIDRVREGGLIGLVVPYRYIHSTEYQNARERLMKESRLLSLLPVDFDFLRIHSGVILPFYVLVLQRMVASHKPTQREQLFMEPTIDNLRSSTFRIFRYHIMQSQPCNRLVIEWFHTRMCDYYDADPALILNSGQGTDDEPYLLSCKSNEREFCRDAVSSTKLGLEIYCDSIKYFKERYFEAPKAAKRYKGVKRLAERISTTVPYTDQSIASHLEDGLMVVFKGQLGKVKHEEKTTTTSWVFIPSEESRMLSDYIALRDLYWRLTEDETNLAIKSQVAQAYDYFLKTHGGLLKNETALSVDTTYPRLKALVKQENGEESRMGMLSPIGEVGRKVKPKESLLKSLDDLGRVDMDYLMALTGLSLMSVRDALSEEIFFDPLIRGWVTRDQLLTGNLYDKVDAFNQVTALGETEREERDRSVQEMRKATPEPIPFDLIGLSLGERWMDTDLLADFAKSLYGVKTVIQYEPVTDTYSVAFTRTVAAMALWRIGDKMDSGDLLKCALQNTYPVITRQLSDGQRSFSVTDGAMTQLAESRIEEIRERFETWLSNLPDTRKKALQAEYNRRFNGRIRPRFDGSFQTFPGLDLSGFPYDELYPSQKDAIWMIKQNGGGIVDHEVGTGKTMIMVVAAHEMRRLGQVRKPLIIAMNTNIHDIAEAYRKAYPNDRLFYPGKTGFTPRKRQEALSEIRDKDWDCVLLTHGQFGLIPHSVDTIRNVIEEELSDIARSMDTLGDNRLTAMVLERRAKVLEKRLEKMMDMETEEGIDFESLGIDHILVDESHNFKNLGFTTRHTMVAGLGNLAGSSKAEHLYIAIQEIQKRKDGDLGATFLSGTTVINSLTELYALFRYLRPRALSGQSIRGFDAWAAVFAEKSREYEFSVTNAIISKERMRRFMKVPELAAFYGEITDYRTAEMIGIDRPRKNTVFVKVEQTNAQKAFIMRLIQFAKTGNALLIDRKPLTREEMKSKMLIATDYARKMALDLRLIDPAKYGPEDSGKLEAAAERIAEYYRRYDSDKGTQLVFCDLGVLSKGSWSVYQELTDILVRRWGIPEEEIRAAQEFTSEKAKRSFCEKVNEGTIRVVLGSTQVLGTGLNIQRRAVAVHHLDTPWRPADLEQREGRAIRKGNWLAKEKAGNQVDVLVYATENSLDLFKFNLLQNKQTFVTQMKQGQYGGRQMDEGSMSEDTGMSFAEYVAILSGNNDLLQKATLEKKIAHLERDWKIFKEETYRLTQELESLTRSAKALRKLSKDMLSDYDYYMSSPAGDFMDTEGNTLQGKSLGRYLAGFRGERHCAEPKVLGTYHGHTVYVHTVGEKTQFGLVGHSGRHYGAKTGLPQKFEAVEEWLGAQGPLWAERAVEAKERAGEQQEAVAALREALPLREWSGKKALEEHKAELKALSERIRQNLDLLDGISPEDIPIQNVTFQKGKGNVYELGAEVGDVRICRRVGYNRANELIEEKISDEEIARRFFVWGNPDYVTRQTDMEHLKLFYEQWWRCIIEVRIPEKTLSYGTLKEVRPVMSKDAPFPSVDLVVGHYGTAEEIIRVSYENKLHIKDRSYYG